jgi:hypothetical protein
MRLHQPRLGGAAEVAAGPKSQSDLCRRGAIKPKWAEARRRGRVRDASGVSALVPAVIPVVMTPQSNKIDFATIQVLDPRHRRAWWQHRLGVSEVVVLSVAASKASSQE